MMVEIAATFDLVCAELTCPACGRTPSAPCGIDLQTKLSQVAEMREIHVGDRIDVPEDLEAWGYLRVGDDPAPEPVRVIEAWSCEHCGADPLWARLTVENGVLTDVSVTSLAEKDLQAADFLSGEIFAWVDVEAGHRLQTMAPAERRAEIARLTREMAP